MRYSAIVRRLGFAVPCHIEGARRYFAVLQRSCAGCGCVVVSQALKAIDANVKQLVDLGRHMTVLVRAEKACLRTCA